ncbi:hypothetical protein DFH09DRAFT_1086135 [Mycena vulgaris]|nr:hypothetical protein DFH09DRAFT_1086135 [Mycena vulgaris]
MQAPTPGSLQLQNSKRATNPSIPQIISLTLYIHPAHLRSASSGVVPLPFQRELGELWALCTVSCSEFGYPPATGDPSRNAALARSISLRGGGMPRGCNCRDTRGSQLRRGRYHLQQALPTATAPEHTISGPIKGKSRVRYIRRIISRLVAGGANPK